MADTSKIKEREAEFAKGQRNYKDLFKAELRMKIHHAQKNLDIKISRFLTSNRRVDRDAVIRKREQILTYKELLNDELFQ